MTIRELARLYPVAITPKIANAWRGAEIRGAVRIDVQTRRYVPRGAASFYLALRALTPRPAPYRTLPTCPAFDMSEIFSMPNDPVFPNRPKIPAVE